MSRGLAAWVVASFAAAQTSCALFYDFDEGEGGASSTRASSGSAPTATTSLQSASASDGTTTGGWCQASYCFGAGCASETSCNERVFDLMAPGRRIHIDATDAAGPSVAVSLFDVASKELVPAVATADGVVISPNVFATATAMGGLGFVSHDSTYVAMAIAETPERLVFVERSSWTVVRDYETAMKFPGGGRVNGVEPVGGPRWVATLGSHLVSIDVADGTAQFADLGEVVEGAAGHGLARIDKDRLAFSYFATPQGCVGVAHFNAGGWLPDCGVFPNRALGVAVSADEVFYMAQSEDGLQDIVGAWGFESLSERTVARMPATSSGVVAVDARTVYFEAAKTMGRALYACPKDGFEQDPEATCERIVERPDAMPILGGMASARIHAGQTDERWLVCWTIDRELRCRVTPPAGVL